MIAWCRIEDEHVSPTGIACLAFGPSFTTTKIAAGTELTLHYGNKFNRDYAVGRPTTVTCPRDLSELFPRGVPWSAIAKISEDMLDEPKDRGDDGEWRPSQRRRR